MSEVKTAAVERLRAAAAAHSSQSLNPDEVKAVLAKIDRNASDNSVFAIFNYDGVDAITINVVADNETGITVHGCINGHRVHARTIEAALDALSASLERSCPTK